MIGRVVHFTDDRGFGFIAHDSGGADVFVHAKDLVDADTPKRDQRVSFEVVIDSRHNKPRATNVQVT